MIEEGTGRPARSVPGAVANLHTCRSCSAEIVWCVTADGKRIPVDAWPTPGGNVRIVDDNGTRRALVVGATIDLFDIDDDGTRYVAHFTTCPDVNQWRTA